MAASGETQRQDHAGHDGPVHEYQPHEATYSGFMRLLKIGTIVTVVVTAVVVFLIAG